MRQPRHLGDQCPHVAFGGQVARKEEAEGFGERFASCIHECSYGRGPFVGRRNGRVTPHWNHEAWHANGREEQGDIGASRGHGGRRTQDDGAVAVEQGHEEVDVRAGDIDLPADLFRRVPGQFVPHHLGIKAEPVVAVLLEAPDGIAQFRWCQLRVVDWIANESFPEQSALYCRTPPVLTGSPGDPRVGTQGGQLDAASGGQPVFPLLALQAAGRPSATWWSLPGPPSGRRG